MPKKKKASPEPEQYHVEVITAARVSEENDWEYYVKWAGYDSDENSWEPDKNVKGCKRLLSSFWDHVGLDGKDYPVGYELYAKPEWIEKEKEYFARNFQHLLKKKKKTKENTKAIVKGKAVVKKDPWKKYTVKDESSDSDFILPDNVDEAEDDPQQKKRRRSRMRSNSSSSEDRPLRKMIKTSATTTKASASSSVTIKKEKGKERAHSPEPAPKRTKPVTKPVPQRSAQGSSEKPSQKPLGPATVKLEKGMPAAGPKPVEKSANKPAESSGSKKATEKSTAPAKEPTPQHDPAPSPHSLFSASPSPVASTSDLPPTSVAQPVKSSQPAKAAGSASTAKQVPSYRTQPKVKLMEFQEQNVAGGSLIATKQRIAAGSAKSPVEAGPSAATAKGALTANTAEPSPTTAESRPTLPKFKKNNSTKDATGPFSPATPISPEVDMTVNNFLSSIIPPSSMNDDQQHVAPTPVAGPSSRATARLLQPPQVLTRIPKKWKWSGELLMTVARDKAETMCNITISEPTEPRPMGLRLNICLDQVKSIQLQKLHVISDLNMILLACAPVQQFCKITPQDTKDTDALKTLDEYLRNRSSFTYAHIHLDDIPAAILIIFPNSHAQISKLLNVPLYLREEHSLIGALVPWKLSTAEYQTNRWMKPRPNPESRRSLVDPALVEEDKLKILRNPLFSRGLRLNKLTKDVHELLIKTRPKTYCVWFSPADGNVKRPGLETSSLQAILKEYGYKDLGYKSDVSFIFVHIGALQTLHQIHAVGMRRCKQPQLHFMTYGTHPTVPPERWGLREIYPLGGIATFAPSAILGDYLGVRSFIKKLDEHPLWETFIPPHVLGGIVRLACQDADPLTLWDEDNFFLFELFEFIEEGKLALLTAPPLGRHPMLSKNLERKWDDPTTDWIGSQIKILPMNARDLLAHCMRAFNERHPSFDTANLQSIVTKDLMREMRHMQYQPTLMDEYRRYVVFQGPRDKETDETETLELTTMADFKFRDGFFSTT